MTRDRLNRISLVLPLASSGLAFALVLANVVAGVRPQPDENASAHVWQLLMVGQIPLVALFLITSDWRTSSPAFRFGLQLAAIAAACVPVWLAGY